MPTVIELPDQTELEFDDSMSSGDIAAVINRYSQPGQLLHSLFNPRAIEQYRAPVREMALDILPGTGHVRGAQRMGDIVESFQTKSPIGKVLSTADFTLEGAGLAADVLPVVKGIGAAVGAAAPLIPMMARQTDEIVPRIMRAQQGAIGLPMDEASRLKKLSAGYRDLPDSDGGRVLNTDTARELFPEYIADRTKSADVHEDASSIVKELYAEKLQQPAAADELNEVLFTAGGTGAGKSSAIVALDLPAKPQIIYDTNMSTYESAKKKIDQALEAGKDVNVVLVDRDPVDALVNGALPRAERQRAKFGTGRTVPLKEHLKTHKGSREVVQKLAAEYKDNPRFEISVIDNNRGRGNAAVTTLDNVSPLGDAENRLREALDAEFEAGRISEETYKGFLVGE